MSEEEQHLRKAAAAMREQNVEGRGFADDTFYAVADLLLMAADHVKGRGKPCGSCVDQAVIVARSYLGLAPELHYFSFGDPS